MSSKGEEDVYAELTSADFQTAEFLAQYQGVTFPGEDVLWGDAPKSSCGFFSKMTAGHGLSATFSLPLFELERQILTLKLRVGSVLVVRLGKLLMEKNWHFSD